MNVAHEDSQLRLMVHPPRLVADGYCCGDCGAPCTARTHQAMPSVVLVQCTSPLCGRGRLLERRVVPPQLRIEVHDLAPRRSRRRKPGRKGY